RGELRERRAVLGPLDGGGPLLEDLRRVVEATEVGEDARVEQPERGARRVVVGVLLERGEGLLVAAEPLLDRAEELTDAVPARRRELRVLDRDPRVLGGALDVFLGLAVLVPVEGARARVPRVAVPRALRDGVVEHGEGLAPASELEEDVGLL